jgi:predicted AAA+ superfamily ATPase
MTPARVVAEPGLAGPLLESFAVVELMKLASWSAHRPTPFHFRTSDGREVDLVLETASGAIAAIEVKASATLSAADFNGLRTLAQHVGTSFRCGIVLYPGTDCVPFGPSLFAVPFARLWCAAEPPAAPRRSAAR